MRELARASVEEVVLRVLCFYLRKHVDLIGVTSG